MRAFVMVCCVASVLPRSARAEDAEALIEKGVEYRVQGNNLLALEAFRAAHAASPSPRTLAQQGLVEHDLGRWVDSEDHLTAALASPKFPWVRKNHRYLEEALQAAQKHVGKIVITGGEGGRYSISAGASGVLPLTEPIRAGEGKATVSVTREGFLDVRKDIVVIAGSLVSVEVDLVPDRRSLPTDLKSTVVSAPQVASTTTPQPVDVAAEILKSPPPKEAPLWPKIAGVGLIVGGAALVATGGVFVSMDGKGSCSNSSGTGCPRVYETKNQGIAFIAGGLAAGAAGGVVLYKFRSRGGVQVGVLPEGGLVAAGTF